MRPLRDFVQPDSKTGLSILVLIGQQLDETAATRALNSYGERAYPDKKKEWIKP